MKLLENFIETKKYDTTNICDIYELRIYYSQDDKTMFNENLLTVISKIKKSIEEAIKSFINSDDFTYLLDDCENRMIYDIISYIGSKGSIFINIKNRVKYDDYNVYNTLTDNELALIENINNARLIGFYTVGDYYIICISTGVLVISTNFIYESKNTFTHYIEI